MFGGGVKYGLTFGVVVTVLLMASAAGAEEKEISENLDSRASALEADLRRQEAALDGEMGTLTEVGEDLEEAQTQADAAAARARDLELQTRELDQKRRTQQQASAESRALLEDRLEAAYKGQQLEGLALLLESLLMGGEGPNAAVSDQAIRALVEDRESVEYYKDTQLQLKNTVRQLDQKKGEYGESREEQRARAEELRRREAELEDSIGGLEEERGETERRLAELEARIAELEAEEAAGLLDPPASGGGEASREEELRIARDEIEAEPVEELPLTRYRQLYREAAEDYGFGPDWYVLMAVGKIESNHGENMGPSSAGAMGPMQFLPSTWEFAGVDGNGDGAANVMDPEDAIPAAAKYLADSGAPEDWYAALFAYNHAGWYVQEVLEIAERYRLLAGDDTVGPYAAEGASTAAAPAPTYAEEPANEAQPEAPAPPAEDTEPPGREARSGGDAVAPETTQDEAAPERTTSREEDAEHSEYQY